MTDEELKRVLTELFEALDLEELLLDLIELDKYRGIFVPLS